MGQSIISMSLQIPMYLYKSVADPGFPIGRNCAGIFLVKMCAKTKELGPVGGHALGMAPRSTNTSTLVLDLVDT